MDSREEGDFRTREYAVGMAVFSSARRLALSHKTAADAEVFVVKRALPLADKSD
jgi:hypothetical protein